MAVQKITEYTCAICGNDGVKVSRTKTNDYFLRCKFCERRKLIKEENWQGIEAEVKQFDCEPIKNT